MARDYETVAALSAEGKSLREIEGETGVKYRTVGNWLQKPEVKVLVEKFKACRNDRLMRRLRALGTQAADTLEQIVQGRWASDDVPPAVALKAALWRLNRTWPEQIAGEDGPAAIKVVLEGVPRPGTHEEEE